MAGHETVTIWGDGTARREFMNAADLADFIYFAIDRLDQLPQNLNVGLGHDYSITDYYRAVASVVGFSGTFEYDLSKPVGIKQKLVDINNLQSLDWCHEISLIDGITEAYKFYKESLKNEV